MLVEEIIFEKENANDTEGTVLGVFCESGTQVQSNQKICDIETSKVVIELRAPITGAVRHGLFVGQVVFAGQSIAQIHTDVLEDQIGNQPGCFSHQDINREATHFSLAALDLLGQFKGDPADFEGRFVTADNVRARYAPSSMKIIGPEIDLSLGLRSKQLAGHKRDEIKTIGRGPGATFLSVIGVEVVPFGIMRGGAGFFERKILDLVVSCAAKLLGKYPELNAFYSDGKVTYHTGINIGVAFDGDKKLLVYNIRNAEALSLGEIGSIIINGYRKYVGGELKPADVVGATLTVTDLSGTDIDFLFPLLPENQSCIIGITRGFWGGFHLYAGFDHRVSDGRQVSEFLVNLRHEVRASIGPYRPNCSGCGASSANGAGPLIVGVGESGDRILLCKECWKLN